MRAIMQQRRFCPECGGKLPHNARTCADCGALINGKFDENDGADQGTGRGSIKDQLHASSQMMKERGFFDLKSRQRAQHLPVCTYCGGSGEVECKTCVGSGTCSAGCEAGNCPTCKGHGTLCKFCKGTGQCIKCKGTGKCTLCSGEGIDGMGVRCIQCNGSGLCSYCDDGICQPCDGTGACKVCEFEDAPYYDTGESCHGAGKCVNCDGTGKCPQCIGSNICTVCGGTGKGKKVLFGKSHCSACRGSGICPVCTKGECGMCNGDGLCPNVCRTCNGSGQCTVCDGTARCRDCDGKGFVECAACDGEGIVKSANEEDAEHVDSTGE